MTEKQIEALKQWLSYQTYCGVYGTDGDYLRVDEMEKYLPDAITKILKEVQ
jgi:hypothetical protein